ncbi:DoxX family protein [Fulvivirga sp.]|uniref:DoxX family protein n=1 Tax=Fulvivirga sp. TaxID=1931237 RepID=UPI0032EB1A76
MSYKGKLLFKWALIIAIGVQFVAMAYAKLAGEMCDVFLSNGLSLEFMFFVGFMEVLATIGLLTAKFRIKCAIVLSCIMIGAIYVNLQSHDVMQILVDVANIGFLAIVLWLEKEKQMIAEDMMQPSKY